VSALRPAVPDEELNGPLAAWLHEASPAADEIAVPGAVPGAARDGLPAVPAAVHVELAVEAQGAAAAVLPDAAAPAALAAHAGLQAAAPAEAAIVRAAGPARHAAVVVPALPVAVADDLPADVVPEAQAELVVHVEQGQAVSQFAHYFPDVSAAGSDLDAAATVAEADAQAARGSPQPVGLPDVVPACVAAGQLGDLRLCARRIQDWPLPAPEVVRPAHGKA